MRVQIQSLHFTADQKLIQFINKKVDKLSTYHDRIINSDVILSLDQLGTQIKDKVVVVKTHIPGATLVARESSKHFEESMELAYESMRRQLSKHKERVEENLKK
jgi:putative sigma-54 modulation protein